MNANHAAAGTYYPAAQGAKTLAETTDLVINGGRVSAVVDFGGSYTVFVGDTIVAGGLLDGTEGDLMVFFAAEALVATADVEAEAEADVVAVVEALGGTYTFRSAYTGLPIDVAAAVLVVWLRNNRDKGLNIEIKDGTNGMYVEVNNGAESAYAQYHHNG